ncbi:sigma-70 family RNA polymerase sigma factor [Patescibacteria group bacterium]|nr:sigma-70 family RNA polymerase sigma factor [Patescibacteria group bacterium]MCL5798289.1 sigma-70 family RNA polymerase sigma factor [Patescibacteria group bacterium]
MMSEKEIINGILHGNEKTLRFFYLYYQPRLGAYLKNKVSNEEDAEEILQDTLLATIEGLRDFAFRSSLFTFICSIANHKVIDYYRKKKIKNVVFSHIPDIEPLIATLSGPEDDFNDQLLKQKIIATFRKIAPRYSLILKLKYVYGYSVEEIARKLSISFKSAESQLFRARRAFELAYS